MFLHLKHFAARFGGEFLIEQVPRGKILPQQGIDHGHDEQSNDGRHQQSSDHSAAQRSILLSRLAQGQRHGNHPDNHSERRHQNRPQARLSGLRRGLEGRDVPFDARVISVAHHQNRIRRCDAHGHDRAHQ